MGAWGTAISSNDTYADIYGEFFDLYNDGQSVEDISKKLITDNQETINEPDDSNNFWFALAKAQWECKQLDNDILERVKQIIETGNKGSKKLLFKDNGNRLTDTFKKLIELDLITGCEKQDLINWIILNFNYTHRNKLKEFVYDTVEKTISRNNYPCKSPLIEIKNGQIQKIEQPRTKKYK